MSGHKHRTKLDIWFSLCCHKMSERAMPEPGISPCYPSSHSTSSCVFLSMCKSFRELTLSSRGLLALDIAVSGPGLDGPGVGRIPQAASWSSLWVGGDCVRSIRKKYARGDRFGHPLE
jgi:hypothetical protein